MLWAAFAARCLSSDGAECPSQQQDTSLLSGRDLVVHQRGLHTKWT